MNITEINNLITKLSHFNVQVLYNSYDEDPLLTNNDLKIEQAINLFGKFSYFYEMYNKYQNVYKDFFNDADADIYETNNNVVIESKLDFETTKKLLENLRNQYKEQLNNFIEQNKINLLSLLKIK